MRLTNLPEETLVAVLQLLPLADLLTFRARTQSLKRLVDSSLFLQYRIALGTHGLADNPACALSSACKLGELRSVTRSWHALDFAGQRELRRAERAMKRDSRRAGVVGGEDNEVANVKGKERHEKEYSTKIPVDDLAGGPNIRRVPVPAPAPAPAPEQGAQPQFAPHHQDYGATGFGNGGAEMEALVQMEVVLGSMEVVQ